MKILLLVLHYEPLGGLEIYGRQLTETLLDLGNEVEVWSVFESPKFQSEERVKVKYLAPANKTRMRIYFRLVQIFLFQLLARKASFFDLVITMHPNMVPGVYLASLCRVRPAYMVWAYGSDVWMEWPFLFQKGMEKAQKIIAVSNYTKRSIEERIWGYENIEIIYPPIDVDRFRPSTKERGTRGTPILLTVSRLSKDDKYKGHDMVIKALPKIEEELGSTVQYRIVGSGDGAAYLKDLAQQERVLDSVVFLGKVSDEDLLSEYRNCDVFIMPSRIEPSGRGYETGEGFGIVYAEAAACGKPVVGSKHGGAQDALIDGITGYMVDPESIKEITRAVCTILKNTAMADIMGKSGRRFVMDNFTMQKFARRIEEVIS
jgi:glycosyltransferase involved in cell wall biosynthesis